MKRLILFLSFIISVQIAFTQNKDENSSLSRREIRKARQEKEYQMIKEMLQNRSFVLEASFLQDKYGRRKPVSNGINFVSVDSNEAIIQVGSNYGLGANGVGGVTARGKITSWNLNENRKGKFFALRINVMTNIGFYDLYFSVSPSGRATAQLNGIRSGRLTFDGNIVPFEDSSIYVGRSL